MDKLKISELLGAHPYGAFWIKDIHLFSWGNEVVFECLYEPGAPAEPIPFQLVLHDCRDIQWRVYAHLKPPDDRALPATSMVNVHLGTGDHRKPLHMLTDSFGITVSYQTLQIERPLPPPATATSVPPSPRIEG
jgi:hypothetical protein